LVRREVVYSLKVAFEHLEDKTQIWEDLHRLANDEDKFVRSTAADFLKTIAGY